MWLPSCDGDDDGGVWVSVVPEKPLGVCLSVALSPSIPAWEHWIGERTMASPHTLHRHRHRHRPDSRLRHLPRLRPQTLHRRPFRSYLSPPLRRPCTYIVSFLVSVLFVPAYPLLVAVSSVWPGLRVPLAVSVVFLSSLVSCLRTLLEYSPRLGPSPRHRPAPAAAAVIVAVTLLPPPPLPPLPPLPPAPVELVLLLVLPSASQPSPPSPAPAPISAGATFLSQSRMPPSSE